MHLEVGQYLASLDILGQLHPGVPPLRHIYSNIYVVRERYITNYGSCKRWKKKI